MANVAFTISPAPGITQDMIAVLYDNGAEVDRLPIPYPHTSPQDLDFINVAPKTYVVKIHETPDGTTLGNLRHDFWVDASLQKLQSYTVKTFQVGAGRGTPYFDPADHDVNYINTDLDGLDYTVFKPGYGPLDWSADIAPYTGGGFSFTNGQEFAQDEIYTILINNLVTQPIQQTGVGFPDGVITINADTAFGATHYNKILEIDPAQEVLTITIDLATVPDGTQFIINTQKHNGVLINAVLALQAGQTCTINGQDENNVYIGKSENVTFYKKGSFLRQTWDGDYRRVGEIIFSDGTPPTIPNILALTGFWIDKARVPRIWNWYINRLTPGQYFSGTDGVTPAGDDIHKWGIGATQIWIKDYRNMHLRVNDGTKVDNAYQPDSLGPGTVNSWVFTGQGVLKNGIPGGSSAGVGFLATRGDGGFVDTVSASGTNNNDVRIDPLNVISPTGENNVRAVWIRAYVII
jgi:hypothetical protein